MNKLPTIPFISNINKQECIKWIEHLQAVLPNFHIVGFEKHKPSYWHSSKFAIVANPDPDDLKKLPNLLWVQSVWAGVEKIVSTLPEQIAIVRMTDPQLAKTMAEAVLMMTLYLHRDIPTYAQQQKEQRWQQHPVLLPEDRNVTVLGLGTLGRTACLTLINQGFNVSGWSHSLKSIPDMQCFHGEQGLATALNSADIIIVLLPLTDNTKGLINETRLNSCKQGASIINFARGQIIDTEALLNAIHSKKLKHAVLDVFAIEPLPIEDALWKEPNITILPHISAPTNMKTASKLVANNINAYINAGTLPEVVDRIKGY